MKHHIKFSVLFLSSFLLYASAYAQVGAVPPSPTASALGEYGNSPVSLYTGRPNISVPLYTLKQGDLELPVSLSYNAAGIKVEEMASWVGLGWSLNAGGVITRAIRAKADESSPNGYLHRADDIKEIVEKDGSTWSQAELNTMIGLADGDVDGSPDIFFFNFNGYSGSFVLDHDGTPRVVPHQNVKVERNGSLSTISSFVVTTGDGTKYYFGEVDGRTAYDATQTENICNGNSTFSDPLSTRTSWYLLKVESQSGNVLELEYAPHSITYANPNASETYIYEVNASLGLSQTLSCASFHTINGSHLTKITSDNEEIRFVSYADREEITGDSNTEPRLDRVDIRRKDTGNTLFKYFDFTQGYYNATGNAIDKRLRLDEVVERDAVGVGNATYRFEYNGMDLPARDSKAQDHWGYYNGETRNSSLVPQYVSNITLPNGGNRQTNPTYAQAGVLEKIHYPTGGYTSYEYESHVVTETRIPTRGDCAYIPGCGGRTATATINCTGDMSNCNDKSVDFTVPVPQEVSFSVNFNLSSLPSPQQIECDNILWVEDANGDRVTLSPTEPGFLTDQDIFYCADYRPGVNAPKFFKAYLQPGTYTLKADVGQTVWQGTTANISADYIIIEGYTPGTPVTIDVPKGGLRVKKIEAYDPVTNQSSVKTYEYPSGGTLLAWPQYHSAYTDAGVNYEAYSSKSYVALGTTQGATVGYTKVVEKLGENAENGSREYTFSFVQDGSPSAGYQMPFIAKTSMEWQRGLGETVKVYDSSHALVSETTNDFNFAEDRAKHTVKGYVADYDKNVVYINNIPAGHSVTYQDFVTAETDHISQWVYNRSTVTRTYNRGSDDYVETRKEFHFDNDQHLNLTKEVFYDSDSIKQETTYTYPEDIPSPATLITDMVNRHMVNMPLETKTLVDGELVAASATQYGQFGNSILPATQLRFNVEGTFTSTTNGQAFDTGYDTLNTYLRYDEKGNILEYVDRAGVHYAFLWGYNRSFPMLRAQHATYDEVIAAIPAQDLSDLEGDGLTDAQVRNILNLARQALPNAQITTYTYGPGIGMTSETSANGITLYYEYDGFGRLQLVKDRQGNILKKYAYHYAE